MSGEPSAQQDARLRLVLKRLLEGGLITEIEPRAYTHEQVMEVVARLAHVPTEDHVAKLVVGGFTSVPYGEGEDEQACDTCMYYQVHRGFCELPELMLPVGPKWSCRLWRI
ncbi:MAG: hypothetical protein AAF184_12790 [Pseudomonadota bacterium]